jgi:hypothetical protein
MPMAKIPSVINFLLATLFAKFTNLQAVLRRFESLPRHLRFTPSRGIGRDFSEKRDFAPPAFTTSFPADAMADPADITGVITGSGYELLSRLANDSKCRFGSMACLRIMSRQRNCLQGRIGKMI